MELVSCVFGACMSMKAGSHDPIFEASYYFPGGGLPIKSDGGSECWALPLTLKYKKTILFLTTLEYNFCKIEAPEV